MPSNTVLRQYPTGGGESTRLNAPLVNGGDVRELMVRSDGGRVLYLADQDTDDKVELYSVAPGGGSSVKMNGALADDGNVLVDGLAFSPDGNRVLYAADQVQDQQIEIFSVPTLGGTAVRLNGTLANGGDVTPGSQWFSPNGSRVLYRADQNTDDVFEIFSVPSTGGATSRLNGTLVTGGDVSPSGLQFSPDGGRVLYTADQEQDEIFELYSVPSVGGAATKLSGTLVAGGDVVDDATFSPDGSRVLFRGDRHSDEVVELFSVPSTGGVPQLLNGPLVIGGNVVRAEYSPDGQYAIYLADQEVDQVFELFAVAADGGAVRKISGPLTDLGDVVDWKFSPDGSTLIYRADQEDDQLFQLYAVELSDGLPGDFNGDGSVDAADYTVWRDTLSGAADGAEKYGVWKSNFGRKSGEGEAAAVPLHQSVPEPAAWVLTIAAITASIRCGHRRGRYAR